MGWPKGRRLTPEEIARRTAHVVANGSPLRAELLGQRFGYLTVIANAERPSHRRRLHGTWWRVRCDCGTERVVTASDLSTGNTTSCGNHRRSPPGTAGRHAIFCQYRCNARTRGLDFQLSKEQFLTITSRNCTYCGAPPSNTARHTGGNSKPETIALSLYLYNGIDRVDNTRGYVDGNCVPCCKQCNRAKTDMTVEEFHTWVARVHARATGASR